MSTVHTAPGRNRRGPHAHPWRRVLSVVLALATAAIGMVALATPASANGDLLWFRIGTDMPTTATYGANAPIRIGGKFYFKNEGCPEDGVPDFVYPTSDVYIVVPGTEEGHLVDATGGAPNTVVQYGSIFDDEIIGITQPAGKLGAGTYDIVFDTCQDGIFDPDVDTVFPRALTVTMPAGDIPAADASLTALKQASYDEYESWKQTKQVMDWVWKQVQKALKTGCKAGNPTACALKYGNYFNPIQEQFSALLLNQGQHYLGIYEDPPNPSYDAPVQLPAVSDTLDPQTDAVAGEGALTTALLKAVEAYKGAQAAGDREWALVHAREARDLYAALSHQLDETDAQLQDLSDSFGDDADNALVWANHYSSRIVTSGFDNGERKALLEDGMSGDDINALEADLRANRTPVVRSSTVREALAGNIAAHQHTRQALADGITGWTDIVNALKVHSDDVHPVVDAGGLYTATEDAPTGLHATAAAGLDVAWDLDGDRVFDDATGADPTVTFPREGSHVIGVRVTDGDGRTGFGWTSVDVAAAGTAPTVDSASPADQLVTQETSSTKTFAVATSDDTGGIDVAWSVDGDRTGTGPSYDWTAPATPGAHELTATVTDADGHAVTRSWDVQVHRPDADGDGWSRTTDCDDTAAVVHPGRTETLGNGVDDDCDRATPDSPPGGLKTTMFGWGYNGNGLIGTGVAGADVATPTQSMHGNDVVQVEAGDRTTYVVKADGSVKAWGQGHFGMLGDGSGSSSTSPVAPLGIGGGALTGVTQIDASLHTLALRTDGTVVAWGNNGNRELGDGSTVNQRNAPVQVLTAPSTPLTDVVQVAAGESQSYALKSDGTVVGWGYVTCDGSTTDGTDTYATPVPGLTHVRKIVADGTVAVFLRDDGTALSCGSPDQILGRDYQAQGQPKSAYVPLAIPVGGPRIVDASLQGDVGVLATDDGRVLTWGQNTNQSLNVMGLVPGGALQYPTQVSLPSGPPVVHVVNTDSSSTFAIRADGSVLVWGGNIDGINGLGSFNVSTDTPTVVSIPGRIVVGMATASWNSYALTVPASDQTVQTPASWAAASVADKTVPESGPAHVAITLDQPVRNDVDVPWAVKAESAGADDASLGTGTATIPAGATSVDVPIDVTDDAVDEPDETLTFVLTGASLGVQLGRPEATVTIADDDAEPTVSVEPVGVDEGDTSLTDVPVHFRLSAASGKDVTVQWSTSDESAKAGSDYVAGGGSFTIPAGQTEHVLHLSVTGDTVVEPDEAFTVSASGAGSDSADVTIRDDEPLGVSADSLTVTEGTGAETTKASVHVTVAPKPLAGESVDVPWRIEEPSAGGDDADGDVVAASGTARLTPDSPTATVVVEVAADALPEGVEHANVLLGTPTASDGRTVLVGRQGLVTIADDDVVETPPTTWPFTGFFAPVDNPPVVNVVKAGSTVPVKWSLGGYRGMDVVAGGAPSSAKHVCKATSVLDPLESTATAASMLTYDADSDRYLYTWRTPKSWAGTCRQLVLTLTDGTTHVAEFRFK